jgi:enoyl-CoA hydratase
MIELEQRGATSILRMVRGKGNALDIDFLSALDEALGALDETNCRAVVITGQGSSFGAGVDLSALLAGGANYARRFLPKLSQVIEHFATFEKPVVAAVNGHAIAGGAIIMLAADQRLLARGTARIGLSEIQVGVLFPSWPLEIVRYRTPVQHFSTIICTGRTWLPDDALRMGLVDELVEPERLIDRACEVAAEMGAVAPATFAATKRAVRAPMIEAVRRDMAGDAAVVEQWCSPETLKQIANFAARNIKGRK